MERLDFDNFEPLLGGWAKYLKEVFESEEMYNLYQEFKNCNERITPESKNLYKFLELCPPENLKVIIIGMDAYSGLNKDKTFQATGISFDCSNSNKCQPSLEYFWEGLSEEFDRKLPLEHDIRYLCERGVLLGNRALNCKLNKTGSFIGKWDFFWKFFFEKVIFSYFPGVPVVLLGKEAHKLEAYIFNMQNPVFKLTHPSFSARTHTTWETNNTFTKINKLIEMNNGREFIIQWERNPKGLEVST